MSVRPSFSHQIARVTKTLVPLTSIGFVAGFVAGAIAGGFGSRFAMRISAVTAGPELRGRTTEGGNVVGEFTLAGTLFLSVASGIFGVYGGLLYVSLKPWIPGSWLVKGLTFGLLMLLMSGYVIIDGDNFDFYRFGSAPLDIGMLASIFILFGLVVATVAERFDRLLSISLLRIAKTPVYFALTLAGLSAYDFWVTTGASGLIFSTARAPSQSFLNTPLDPFPPHPVPLPLYHRHDSSRLCAVRFTCVHRSHEFEDLP